MRLFAHSMVDYGVPPGAVNCPRSLAAIRRCGIGQGSSLGDRGVSCWLYCSSTVSYPVSYILHSVRMMVIILLL